jgi:hypothetical protein
MSLARTKPQSQTEILLSALGTWWRNWMKSRATIAEIEGLGDAEMSRVAQDVNLGVPELRTLAGRWPDAADLLSQRLAALELDTASVVTATPGVLRDMQRVCSGCSEKGHCGHDIDRDPSSPEWRQYCPNVETLEALETERSLRRLDHAHRQ